MSHRFRAGVAGVALSCALTWPSGAGAHHVPCNWGATVAVDPSSPRPVDRRLQAPTWGCPGPVSQVTLLVGGRKVVVYIDQHGASWQLEEERAPTDGAPAEPMSGTAGEPRLWLRITPGRVRAGERVRFRLRADWVSETSSVPAVGIGIRLAGRRARTNYSGRATVSAVVPRARVLRASVYSGGRRIAVATVKVLPRRGW